MTQPDATATSTELPNQRRPADTCPQCGHAATAAPASSFLPAQILGVALHPARCPVEWYDGDTGLPPDACGCSHPAHAA